MKYYSTRDKNRQNPFSLKDAAFAGLAPDGGLYVPKNLPAFDAKSCLKEDTMTMAARIIGALLPDIPNMESLVQKAYTGKFQSAELPPTVDTGKFTVLE